MIEHCVFAETSPSLEISIFSTLWMIVLDSSLNGLNASVLCRSVIVAFVLDWLSGICDNFWILFFFLHLRTLLLCGTPWTLTSILNLSSSAIGFPMPVRRKDWSSHCTCQASFRYNFWEVTVEVASWVTFPLALAVYLSWSRQILVLPVGFSAHGVRSCKEDRLPSFFGVFFHLWQVLLEGRAWRMECIVLMEVGPSKWNFNIVQWCKINHCASRVTVDGTQVNEKTVGTQATLKSLPVTASSKKIQPLWIRENSRHLLVRNHGVTRATENSNPLLLRTLPWRPLRQEYQSTSFRQPVWTSWREDTMVDSVIGFPSHLFVTRRFSFLCVDFFHVVVRSSGDHNPWEGSGILHGSHLNFDSKLFRRKCDHDLNHWADLCKSADSPHWVRTITVSV